MSDTMKVLEWFTPRCPGTAAPDGRKLSNRTYLRLTSQLISEDRPDKTGRAPRTTRRSEFHQAQRSQVRRQLAVATLSLAKRVLVVDQTALLEDWMTSGSVRTCDHDVVTVIREIPKIIRTLRREILDDPVCQQLLDSPDSPFRFFEVNINDWLRAAVPLGRK